MLKQLYLHRRRPYNNNLSYRHSKRETFIKDGSCLREKRPWRITRPQNEPTALIYSTSFTAVSRVVIFNKLLADMGEKLLEAFEARRLTAEDYASEIKDFIVEFYSKGDVLAQASNSTLEDEDGIYAFRAKVAIEQHDASFAMYERSSGKLVAIKVNFVHRKAGSSTPTSMINDGYAPEGLSENARVVIRFVDNFFGDIFTELQTDCYMELGITCVHRDYAKLGLATYLGKLSAVRAKELDCKYMVSFGTSVYTQKICIKFGFTFLREIVYAQYVDPVTGKKPFHIIPEQTHARLYYKKV